MIDLMGFTREVLQEMNGCEEPRVCALFGERRLSELAKGYGRNRIYLLESSRADAFGDAAEWLYEELLSVCDGILERENYIRQDELLATQVLNVLTPHFAGRIGTFEVEAQLQGNVLEAHIFQDAPTQGNQYCFYLLKDGTVYARTDWSGEPNFQWTLEEDGIYVVQGYLRYLGNKQLRLSNAVEFFTDAAKAAFQAFLQKELPVDGLLGQKEIRENGYEYPYVNCVLISCTDADTFSTCRFDYEEAMAMQRYVLPEIGGWRSAVFSQEPCRHGCFFSGIANIDGRLVIGDRELRDDMADKLAEATGYFTNISINDQSIRLSSDFFGMCRFYYFRGEGIMAASNSYWLLLKTLRQMGVKAKLDSEKAAALLSAISYQLLQQNFSRDMDIKGTFQLCCDETLNLTVDGWSICSSACGSFFSDTAACHRREYTNLLHQARDEVIDAVRMVLEDERYEEITLDLSGGLDSRVVYAAATNIPGAEEKVQIRSLDVAGSGDLDVATALNSVYAYPFDCREEKYEGTSVYEMDGIMRGYFIGTYYAHNLSNARLKNGERRIALNGACGEIVARPYYTRKFLRKHEHEPLSALKSDIAPVLITDSDKAAKYLYQRLEKELERIPGRSAFQRYERLYHIFRNGYHFTNVFRRFLGINEWAPMQSKAMFRLYNLAYDRMRTIKPQIDLLYQLNPLLATIPFEGAEDNSDIAGFYQELIIEDCRYRNIHFAPVGTREAWSAANQVKQKARSRSMPAEWQKDWGRVKELTFQSLLYNFQALMRHETVLCDCLGTALYHFIMRNREDAKRIRYLYNKVTSLLDQIKIMA